MTHYEISPAKLKGHIVIPSSKSHTLRSILFAALAKGESIIKEPLDSPDTEAMLNACQALGAKIKRNQNTFYITGTNKQLTSPDDVIDAGNSGQVLRFIGAVASLLSTYTVITGDHSIRHNRPVGPLLSGLQQLGAMAKSMRMDDHAPIIIKGPIKPGEITIDGQDSQPVSALLIACSLLSGSTIIHVENPGEKPWIALTLHWFDKLGIHYSQENYKTYHLNGNAAIDAFDYTVPGDFSALAYPIAAALLTQSEITISPVDMADIQGDKAILAVLEQMGAVFEYEKATLTLTVKKCQRLQGCEIDINPMIDAITILAVIGCFAEGETKIIGAAVARFKECDRISAICQELKKMGANIEELPDGLVIKKSKLRAADVNSHQDHRMAMALACAALIAEGTTRVHDIKCINKSFPGFADKMHRLGMKIEESHKGI